MCAGMKKSDFLIFMYLLVNLFCLTGAKGQNYEKIDSLQYTLIKTLNGNNRVNILMNISREFELYNIDSSLKYAQQALAIAKPHNNFTKGTVNAYVQVGRLLQKKNEFGKAIESCESAIEMAEKSNMYTEAAIAYGVIAIIYAELGNYDNSAKYNFKSLELLEKTGNKVEIGITLGNIAADLLSQRNYEKALDYMNQSLKIAKETNDRLGVAQQYNNIAGVYLQSFNDSRKALVYFNKSYKVNKELSDKLQVGINVLNIGYCYFSLHENDSAFPYFKDGLKIFKEINNPLRIADGELAMAKYYRETGELDTSIEYSKDALNIGMVNNSKEIIADASDILHLLYLTKKDTINAYKYSRINFEARDSLQNMQSKKNLFKLEYQYNYEKQDKERKLKQQRSNFILWFAILGLMSGIIIILLIYSRQRIKIKNSNLEKLKMASDLKFKNKELTINLMALKKKNEMLAEISKKMIVIEKKVPKEELRDAIIKLNRELKQTSDEKVWKEFALRFNQTNSDFYGRLLNKYPDLTQNELKLCAYLRLNMTSKEISEITGQRTLTLENARYRLRKKLGISGSDNNLVTFLTQL